MKHEKVYLLTDGCMWEKNKKEGTAHAHAVEVVDIETGAVVYIRSGSRIAFVEGSITDIRTQEVYNKVSGQMPGNGQDKPNGARRKGAGKKGNVSKAAGV